MFGTKILPLVLGLALLGCGPGESEKKNTHGGAASAPAAGLSVLLVTLDTTRVDALSAYAEDGIGSGAFGAAPGTTPNLDALAARGVRYTKATSVAPLTLPTHASMLTGQIPPAHGIRENGLWGLAPTARTITEEARAAGLRTGAFVGAVVLDRSYGLDQGFEVYDQPERPAEQTSTHFVDRPADEVVDAALAWLGKLQPQERFFGWVHLFDPHQPYAPPGANLGPGADQEQLYQGEVHFMDAQLGRIFDSLRSSGRDRSTLILVTADHGESLGEHGEWSHAAFCYGATLHVPFLVVYPNGFRAGEVSEETVSVVDVAATARAAMGLASDTEGHTFEDGLSLFGHGVPADRRVYFESFSGNLSFGWAPIVGLQQGDWKVLISGQAQVFDLAADPDETRDLAADQGARVEAARSWLAQTLEGAQGRAPGARTAHTTASGSELAALGYAAAAAGIGDLPDPLKAGHLPAPHARAAEYRDTLRASALQNEGHHEEAQRLAHSIVVKNSGNVVALQTWTAALLSLQRYGEAVPGLQRLVAMRPTTAGFHYNLGVALARSAQEDAAIRSLWRAVELDLEHESYLAELQQLLRSLGRRDEFEAFGRRWQALRAAQQSHPPR